MSDILYAEILDGKEMEMSRPNKNHIKVTGNLYHYLYEQFDDGRYTIVLEPNLYLDDNNLFFPDIVICREEIVQSSGIYDPPELVVEILSPSTSKIDKQFKFNKYFDFGILEYWIVEPNTGMIDVYYERKLWDSFHYVTDEHYNQLSSKQKELVRTKVKSCVFPNMELELKNAFRKINIM